MFNNCPPFLLASSSPYRAKLISQLGLTFDTFSPNIDESSLANEAPEPLALRLSEAKARAAQKHYPNHIIIASDQVACLEDSKRPIGKPNTIDKAIAQLQASSGKKVFFYTGLSVLIPKEYALSIQKVPMLSKVETFTVLFRNLSDAQIQQYIYAEQPLRCAGSFKAEGLGIALFEAFEGRDYNTLIGLPLMALVDALIDYDIDVLNLQRLANNVSE